MRQNAGTVQEHIAQYQAIIDDLKEENDQLKLELNTLQVSTALRTSASLLVWAAVLDDDDQDASRHWLSVISSVGMGLHRQAELPRALKLEYTLILKGGLRPCRCDLGMSRLLQRDKPALRL